MTKAKTNVTSMVPTEETKEFKKSRMKEVRTMVARAHKQGKRIDQMGFEGTDIPRAMIALQDLLTKTQERHRKATQHIAFANQMGEALAFIMDHAAETTLEQTARIADLSTALYNERMDHAQTASMLQEAHRNKHDIENDLHAVKRAMSILNG